MLLLLGTTILVSSQPYMPFIESEAKRHKIDPLLVVAVIWHESRFQPRACYRGAHGLMQIQLRSRSCRKSRRAAIRKGLYRPDRNIRRGLELMAWWKSWWERHPKRRRYHWLLHYNQGFGVCPARKKRCRASKRMPIRSGRIGKYARKILRTYAKLKSMFRV